VDDGLVHRVLREDPGDFDRYLASIGQYLKADLWWSIGALRGRPGTPS
jgi:hypothetical protein